LNAAVAFIFVSVLPDMVALGVMIPVLPRLVVEFLGGGDGRAATIDRVFGTEWAAMQFVARAGQAPATDLFRVSGRIRRAAASGGRGDATPRTPVEVRFSTSADHQRTSLARKAPAPAPR